jgi:hypothetical protein
MYCRQTVLDSNNLSKRLIHNPLKVVDDLRHIHRDDPSPTSDSQLSKSIPYLYNQALSE